MAETKAQLEERNAALEAKVVELEKENSELSAKAAELTEANYTLEQALAEQHEQLKEVAEQSAASPVGATSVEVGKKKYEITAKSFSFKGEDYTAEQLAGNPKLAAELVKIESGILKEII